MIRVARNISNRSIISCWARLKKWKIQINGSPGKWEMVQWRPSGRPHRHLLFLQRVRRRHCSCLDPSITLRIGHVVNSRRQCDCLLACLPSLGISSINCPVKSSISIVLIARVCSLLLSAKERSWTNEEQESKVKETSARKQERERPCSPNGRKIEEDKCDFKQIILCSKWSILFVLWQQQQKKNTQ